MVELRTISPTYLMVHVYEAFRGDRELIDTYHLVNGSLMQCITSTVTEIRRQADRGENLVYLGVYQQGAMIGYSILAPSCLFSFGIHIASRTKDVLMDWWRQICFLLNGEFATWIWAKNTRALAFLQRNGMEITESKDGIIGLTYDKVTV